mmetsp:Transcript_39172/g.90453  ORF Transcript_39172/g.90453 Transcript_39172/m.90453 type:complete len:541 (-) Transcript_39172:41-1663(-)
MAKSCGRVLVACLLATTWHEAAADTTSVDLTALMARMDALQAEVTALREAEAQDAAVPRKLLKTATVKGFGNRRVPGKARFEKEVEGRELTWATWPEAIADLQGAMNHMWLILCGALVMLMQAGFAMLESGACRSKNAQNLLMKNLADLTVGTLCWWSFGWMFAYGADEDPNMFAGTKQYFSDSFFDDVTSDGTHVATDLPLGWFFQWAFCGAAATIVSGGVAERINFHAYAIYSCWLTAFVYPVVVFWTWSGSGWLYGGEDAVTDIGYYDFAGSGIVHMTGGIGALCGAIVLGPRLGRFDDPNSTEFDPHNVPLLVLGTFILWFGWYGFNCGSTLGLADTATGRLAAHVAMNTTIAPATGGITVLLLKYAVLKRYDVGGLCNGILAGLVSITAPCGNVTNWSAFLIAIIGGLVYFGASTGLKLAKVDDPLDAFPVHGACGAWGALAAVIFDMGKGFDFFNGWSGFSCEVDADGACYSGGWTSALGAQVVGIICIILWVGATSLAAMVPMRVLGIMRASDEVQTKGMDEAKHSPSKAYVA